MVALALVTPTRLTDLPLDSLTADKKAVWLREWFSSRDDFVHRAAQKMGIPTVFGQGFPCIVPGHSGHNASLIRDSHDAAVYFDHSTIGSKKGEVFLLP